MLGLLVLLAQQEEPPTTGASQVPSASPNSHGLPMADDVTRLLDVATWLGLAVCVLGVIVAGGTLAFAYASSNSMMSGRSSTGVLFAAIGAILVGGASALVGWLVG